MKIVEERKALEQGFQRLQRIYKEWERNPSALVRDSLKKYLIECYDHLLNLDRIDIDAGILEEKIMSGTDIPEPRMVSTNPPKEDKIEYEEPRIEHIAESKEEVIEEEVSNFNAESEEEQIESSSKLEQQAEIGSVNLIEDEEEETVTLENCVEISLEALVNEEEEKKESELKPEDVYLSGDEEREIEEYFKTNFAESKIDEAANKIIEETPIDQTIEPENVEQNEENTVVEETEVVSQEEEKEESEELISEPVSENKKEMEKPEEVTMQQETIEEKEETADEEVEEPAKSRWSSFFSKDETKPYENEKPKTAGQQQQLTLADKLALGTEEKGAHYEVKEQGVADLNSAIPIAKKFEFIRELFGDDSNNYKSAVANINEAGSLQIALDISENLAETYNWANKEKLAGEFNVFVNRRFAE